MAIDAKILIKQETQDRAVELFGWKRGNIILARAINKIAVASRQEIQLELRKDMPMKAADLKRRNIQLSKASLDGLTATIKISSFRIPLKYLGARQKKKGVSYVVRKGGGRETLKHAFISDKLGGHVYMRITKDRLPIIKPMGPSVPEVFDNLKSLSESVFNRRITNDLEEMIETQFQVEMDRIG